MISQQSPLQFLPTPSKVLSFPPTIKKPSLPFSSFKSPPVSLRTEPMNPRSKLSNHIDSLSLNDAEIDRFTHVGNKLADAAGEVIRKYFRKKFEIIDKEDLSPVTIADQAAEESMISIMLENFPSHAIYGEEKGWRCKEKSADYVWVLDPIDGTKSFITGKPVFGTLIALMLKVPQKQDFSLNVDHIAEAVDKGKPKFIFLTSSINPDGNMIVLRTFSKTTVIAGLAGLRFGYRAFPSSIKFFPDAEREKQPYYVYAAYKVAAGAANFFQMVKEALAQIMDILVKRLNHVQYLFLSLYLDTSL